MKSKLILQSNNYIYLVHWLGKKPVKITTKIKIEPDKWNATAGRVTDNKLVDAKGNNINSELAKMEGAFLFAVDEFKAGRTSDIEKTYHNRLNIAVPTGSKAPVRFMDYFYSKVQSYRTAKSSNYKGYQLVYNNLTEFFGRKKPVFTDLDASFFTDYVSFLKTVKNYKVSTIRTQIKYIRAIINDARYIAKLPTIEVKKGFTLEKAEEIDSVYLTQEEINKLYACTFTSVKDFDINGTKVNATAKDIEKGRDSFIIGCMTGLRLSDWGKVKSSLIVNGNIEIRSKKVKNTALIPVHPFVTAILKKYNGNSPEPFPNKKANQLIKIACFQAGINQLVKNEYTKGGVLISPEPVEKWLRCQTHTARRSLITNLIEQGASPYDVMNISGHKSLEAFEKYIHIDPKKAVDRLKVLPFFVAQSKPVAKAKQEIDQSLPAYCRL